MSLFSDDLSPQDRWNLGASIAGGFVGGAGGFRASFRASVPCNTSSGPVQGPALPIAGEIVPGAKPITFPRLDPYSVFLAEISLNEAILTLTIFSARRPTYTAGGAKQMVAMELTLIARHVGAKTAEMESQATTPGAIGALAKFREMSGYKVFERTGWDVIQWNTD